MSADYHAMTIEASGIRLRPVREDDTAFLLALYASLRATELELTGWSPEQRAAFVAQQFRAQDTHYRSHYAGARFDLVIVGDDPVGRLYVARWPEEIRIMDLALMPDWRSRGIGTRLLRSVLDEAGRVDKRVSIHVEMFNPAQALYARLGFRPVGEAGVHRLLEWRQSNARTAEIAQVARTC